MSSSSVVSFLKKSVYFALAATACFGSTAAGAERGRQLDPANYPHLTQASAYALRNTNELYAAALKATGLAQQGKCAQAESGLVSVAQKHFEIIDPGISDVSLANDLSSMQMDMVNMYETLNARCPGLLPRVEQIYQSAAPH